MIITTIKILQLSTFMKTETHGAKAKIENLMKIKSKCLRKEEIKKIKRMDDLIQIVAHFEIIYINVNLDQN